MGETVASKSISKKGLYAPLSVCEKDTSSDLAKRKIPSGLRDGALVEFLFKIGQQRNRNGSLTEGKNNGGKPAAQNEVDERIRQRAVTLVGGGINVSITETRKQRRISTHRLACSSHPKRRKVQACIVTSETGSAHNTLRTLERINRIWAGYIHSCLRDMDFKPLDDNSLKAAFADLVADVEVIGAFVSVERCKSQHKLVSTRGYLVGETSSTWTIATSACQRKHKPESTFCFPVMVPKEGSSITVYLRLGHTTEGCTHLDYDGT